MTVYVIQRRGEAVVKIGYTKHSAAARMRKLGAKADVPLDVILELPEATRQGERALHRRFAEHRKHGEWFHLRGDLAAWVRLEQGRTQREREAAVQAEEARQVRLHYERRMQREEAARGERQELRMEALKHLYAAERPPGRFMAPEIWSDASRDERNERDRLLEIVGARAVTEFWVGVPTFALATLWSRHEWSLPWIAAGLLGCLGAGVALWILDSARQSRKPAGAE